MSVWTHLNGNICIDIIGLNSEDKEKNNEKIKKIKNQIISIVTDVKDYDLLSIGYNEDGVQYKIFDTPRGINISIWGDLRNFGDVEKDLFEIESWFNKIINYRCMLEFIILFIRNAILHIQTSQNKNIILVQEYSSTSTNKHTRKVML